MGDAARDSYLHEAKLFDDRFKDVMADLFKLQKTIFKNLVVFDRGGDDPYNYHDRLLTIND